ncbi:MAG: amidohydrolase family protein [Novipirellula sp. JB048]
MKNHETIKLCRRSFVGGSLAATTLAASTSTAAGLETKSSTPTGWIDAHVHVWTPDTQTYPLAPGFKAAEMVPPSFTAEELFAHSKPSGVQRIVLIQMIFYQYDHRYMRSVMRANPGVFSGVALIDHQSEDLVERMDQLARQGMRGFRLHSMRGTKGGDPKEWATGPGMARLWRKAGEDGLAVCPLINPQDIPYVEALCKRFPQTTVVVDHFARIGVSGKIEADALDNLCRLAKYPNTYVKTSAFYALGKKTAPYEDLIPMIKQVCDHFGPERLMWASDCPFQVQADHSYSASIALIRDRIDFLSTSDKQWILNDTAEKVFFA